MKKGQPHEDRCRLLLVACLEVALDEEVAKRMGLATPPPRCRRLKHRERSVIGWQLGAAQGVDGHGTPIDRRLAQHGDAVDWGKSQVDSARPRGLPRSP